MKIIHLHIILIITHILWAEPSEPSEQSPSRSAHERAECSRCSWATSRKTSRSARLVKSCSSLGSLCSLPTLYTPNPSEVQTHTFRESNASQSSSDSMNVSKKCLGDPTNMSDVRRAQNKRLIKANSRYLDSEWNRIGQRMNFNLDKHT